MQSPNSRRNSAFRAHRDVKQADLEDPPYGRGCPAVTRCTVPQVLATLQGSAGGGGSQSLKSSADGADYA